MISSQEQESNVSIRLLAILLPILSNLVSNSTLLRAGLGAGVSPHQLVLSPTTAKRGVTQEYATAGTNGR